jgi:hypothetical protein
MDCTIYTCIQALAAFKIYFMNCGIDIDNEIIYNYSHALEHNFHQVQVMFVEWLEPLIACELVENKDARLWLIS